MMSQSNEFNPANAACPLITLANGIQFPALGLGCAQLEDGGDIDGHVRFALDCGYRLFDTAVLYGNEDILGAALRKSGYPRESYQMTSKLHFDAGGYDSTLRSYENSLKATGMDYLDCYFIHAPDADPQKNRDTWRALERLYEQGSVRSIGVSNHGRRDLEAILAHCNVPPMIDQVEFNPYLQLPKLRAFCQAQGIAVEAWFPLGGRLEGAKGEHGTPAEIPLLQHPVLAEIAAEYNRTVAQIILRWDLQMGVITIPKSTKLSRIRDNFDLFDFALSPASMARIEALDYNFSYGPWALEE